jgi:hypothetical protein
MRRPNPGDCLWSDAQIALLTELWMSGHTSGDCGRALGVTRSSAIGKINRLGLMRRTRPAKPTMLLPRPAQNLLKSNEQVSKPPKKSRQKAAKTPDRYFAEFTRKPLPPPPPEPPVGSFGLADLRHGHCRWPGPEDRPPYSFCGQSQAPNSSYCEEHTKRSLSGLARGTPYVGQRVARS